MFRRLLLFGFGAFLSLFFLAYLSPENKLKNTFYAYLNYFDSDKRIIGQLLLSKEFNYLASNEDDINLFLKDSWVNHNLSDKKSYPQKFVLENIMPERLEASIYYCLDSLTANKVSLIIQQVEDSSMLNINSFHKNMLDSLTKDSLEIQYNKFIKGDNKYIDNIVWKEGAFETIKLINGGYVLIQVHNFFKEQSWRVHCLFYDKEIIKEQGEDRIKTVTNFVKIEKGVSLSSKSYKSSFVVVAFVLSIMFIVIYFIRKKIIRRT